MIFVVPAWIQWALQFKNYADEVLTLIYQEFACWAFIVVSRIHHKEEYHNFSD